MSSKKTTRNYAHYVALINAHLGSLEGVAPIDSSEAVERVDQGKQERKEDVD